MLLTLLLISVYLCDAVPSSAPYLANASLPFSNSSSRFLANISEEPSSYLLPWNITWQFDDMETFEDGRYSIDDEDYDYYYYDEIKEAAVLTKRDKNSKNVKAQTIQGNLRCVRKNGSVMTKSSPPSFRLPSEKMQQLSAGHLGHRVELFCPHRKGCPRAKVEWQKDGQILLARGRKSGLSTIRIKQNGGLIIEDNRVEDDGIYTCLISNQFGTIQHSIKVQSVSREVAMEQG